MKIALSPLLSLNAGFVDTAGFLALHGLFTAHVTGNFVTFGATMMEDRSGGGSKLLVLPVFCAVIILVRLLAHRLRRVDFPVVQTLFGLQCLLLAGAAALAIRFGPFSDADSWAALATGMTLASAMAIQTAVHRVHMTTDPPSTMMTGTTTQIMLDLADLMQADLCPNATAVRARFLRFSLSVVLFALGCGLGALAYRIDHNWCFAIPPLVALLVSLAWRKPE